jgi:hypothetical protein
MHAALRRVVVMLYRRPPHHPVAIITSVWSVNVAFGILRLPMWLIPSQMWRGNTFFRARVPPEPAGPLHTTSLNTESKGPLLESTPFMSASLPRHCVGVRELLLHCKRHLVPCSIAIKPPARILRARGPDPGQPGSGSPTRAWTQVHPAHLQDGSALKHNTRLGYDQQARPEPRHCHTTATSSTGSEDPGWP